MSTRLIDRAGQRPLLDIASYARRGPGSRPLLLPTELDDIRRTVQRAPEVMVKVLTRGGHGLASVQRHLSYLDRGGELELENDDGLPVRSPAELVEDWDLDLDEARRTTALSVTNKREPPKLVHKVIFSMPPGTPPDKLLAAVRDFAREQFALQHRYAMVLHTDEPQPHVHMVIKVIGEDGQRLNIRKATLREWRQEFARHLRLHGVEANATERAVRGEPRAAKLDGIYRADLRGESTHVQRRIDKLSEDFRDGGHRSRMEKERILQTRAEVVQGWSAVQRLAAAAGMPQLASAVQQFVARMPAPLTDNEVLAAGRERQEGRDRPSGRDRSR